MLRTRVIPTLLLKNSGLVKGCQFKNHRYIGDPINAVKIFNEKEVDELVFLDIEAGIINKEPNYELLKDIASEAFMPFGYGGGISSCKQIENLFTLGVEKVILNTQAFLNPQLITDASNVAGSQSIVVSIDVKKNFFGKYEVVIQSGQKKTKKDPIEYAKEVQEKGAGEIFLCATDKEGTHKGYDYELIKKMTDVLDIPVIASGGAGSLQDFKLAVDNAGASAVSAGSLFVFHGKLKAVLITYPDYHELTELFEG